MKNNLKKIVVNVGLGKASQQAQYKDKILPETMKEMVIITGQKPAPRPAKKAIANFKTRVGDIIGLQATLRGKRMDDFLKRLIDFVFPRVKDFRGIELKNIDEFGNLNFGFKDQFVFPEINIEQSKVNFGLQVTLVTSLRTREKSIDFYRSIGLPLKVK